MNTPALEVISARGPAFVQDGGRSGFMHHAVPRGGALVPERLAAANLSLGNRWNAPAIEIFGGLSVRVMGATLAVSLDGDARSLCAGDVLSIVPVKNASVRYLSIAGGIDVPERLGGRGTLRAASLGGFDGRALRRGDRVFASASTSASLSTYEVHFDPLVPIRVVAGPDLDRFGHHAIETLVHATFRISPSSDRVGFRLEAAESDRIARIDADDTLSRPMVRGAIEVPSEGEPIVLGADHPTTGGYPVVAAIIRADQGAFFAKRPGAEVRFHVVNVDAARAEWRDHAARWFEAKTGVSDAP